MDFLLTSRERRNKAVYEYPESGVGAAAGTCENILFSECGHEDLAFLVAFMVVDYADQSVGVLCPVRIRYAIAFVQKQTALPSFPVVIGEAGGNVLTRTPGLAFAAERDRFGGGDVGMVNQQQATGVKSCKKKREFGPPRRESSPGLHVRPQ